MCRHVRPSPPHIALDVEALRRAHSHGATPPTPAMPGTGSVPPGSTHHDNPLHEPAASSGAGEGGAGGMRAGGGGQPPSLLTEAFASADAPPYGATPSAKAVLINLGHHRVVRTL